MKNSSRQRLPQSIFDGVTSGRSRDQLYIFGVFAVTPGRRGGPKDPGKLRFGAAGGRMMGEVLETDGWLMRFNLLVLLLSLWLLVESCLDNTHIRRAAIKC